MDPLVIFYKNGVVNLLTFQLITRKKLAKKAALDIF